MGNRSTKQQLNDFFRKVYDQAKNPDLREIQKEKRKKKAKKVVKKFGL